MGEQADILIQDGMANTCQYCGRNHEWCECDLGIQTTDAPRDVNKPVPKKQKTSWAADHFPNAHSPGASHQ